MRFRTSWIVVALLLAAVQLPAQENMTELRVSAIPDENPQELLRIYKPFTKYLSKEIGIPVKFFPVVDYAATVEGLIEVPFQFESSDGDSFEAPLLEIPLDRCLGEDGDSKPADEGLFNGRSTAQFHGYIEHVFRYVSFPGQEISKGA